MSGTASNFIVNIVELQNTITSASGLTPIAALSNQVAQIQEMVNYTDKQLKVNTISRFNQTPIQFTDSVNFAAGTTITVDGTTIAGGGAGGASTSQYASISTIGYASSLTNYFNTLSTLDTAISFQVGSPALTPLTLTAGGSLTIGGGLKITAAGTPGIGKYLTCMDGAGTAQWQVPAMPSDGRWKEDIQPIADHSRILAGIRGVRFRWSGGGGGRDVGVIAQDLMPVLPEAVIEGIDGGPLMVQYQKIIPVLVESVKALEARVAELERGAADAAAAAARP